MWPMGHVGVAYLAYAALLRSRDMSPPKRQPTLALLAGSLLPDLIDKPLSWWLGVLPAGRSLTHSLVVIVPLTLLLVAVARRYDWTAIAVALGFGAISHSLTDAISALWDDSATLSYLLWPVGPVQPYGEAGSPTIAALLADSLGDPYFYLQWLLFLVALGLFVRNWRVQPAVSQAGAPDRAESG